MKKFSTTLSVIALTALAAPAATAATIIDDFTTAQRVQDGASVNPFFPTTSVVAAPEALGGWRSMTATTNPGGPFAGTVLESGPGGLLAFSNNDGQTGLGVIVYDNNGAGLGGVDLTSGGVDNKFFFEVTSFDQAGAAQFTVDVCSVGGCSTYTELLDGAFNPFLKFSDFAVASGGGANFTAVGSLTFSIESTTPSFDGSIGSISVVPLPASALLLLGGLGGLGGISAAKRRRRKA